MDFVPLASSSAGCCYKLSSGNLPPLLIDAGISLKLIQQGMKFQLSTLAGCLISHCHGDHIKSAEKLMIAGVDCWASKETWEQANIRSHRAKLVDPDHDVKVGPWTVRGFEAIHDVPGTLGFIIAHPDAGKLLYLTDSAYSKYRFNGLTHIAVECNFSAELMRANATGGSIHTDRYKRTTRTHMSLERLIDMLKANDLSTVEEIHLLHLSDQNSDEEQFRLAIQKATGKPVFVAQKGAAA